MATAPIPESPDATIDPARAAKKKPKRKPKKEKPETTVTIEVGGKKGEGKSVAEAAAKVGGELKKNARQTMRQQDLGKEDGAFRDHLAQEGCAAAIVTLHPGHDVGAFQAAPEKPGKTNNPIQFTQVDCVENNVAATNGASAIQVPLLPRDVANATKDGRICTDFAQAKDVLKKPGKDEEIEITLDQTFDTSRISRRTIVRDTDTVKNVVMVPHESKHFPNLGAVIRQRQAVLGKRVVVSAQQLKLLAEYAAKSGDGTILLDVAGSEDPLYAETAVDECGVAVMITKPLAVRDMSNPYAGAYRVTER